MVNSRSQRERIIAGLGLIVCCLMLMSAVPRFIASLYALYPDAVNQAQEKFPPEVYKKSIADLTRALAWHDDPAYWQVQAFFHLALFNALPQSDAARPELLKQAQSAVIHGLKLSPIDPYAWFRLASVDKALGMPTAQIVGALRASFYAGRVEPDLVMARLAFSYDYLDEFDEEMRKIWLKQIPIVWMFQAEQLVKFVAMHPKINLLVKEAFANSPEDWKKFSFALEKAIQKTL